MRVHDLVASVCERPAVVGRCLIAAIRLGEVNGKPSLKFDDKKCISKAHDYERVG